MRIVAGQLAFVLLHNTFPGKCTEISKPHSELEKSSHSPEQSAYTQREDSLIDHTRIDGFLIARVPVSSG
ncbi:hypothetical protein PUN28_017065 [Cardiocondyla obscurior]|uniref:Secreted protein n=1 Tax=Cardiocondyla obscurior TaxID=286306 RepID=A0AAW2EQI9_9HYME